MTHRTAREKARAAAAQTAVARAKAHARQPQDDDQAPAYITPAIARAIRLRIEETRHDGLRPDHR